MFKHNLKAVLNKQRKDKNGNYPVRIRATIKGRVTYYPTGISVKENQFNGAVINHPKKVTYNLVISQKLAELEKAFIEQSLAGVQADTIKTRYKSFYEFIEARLKQDANKYSHGTLRAKYSQLTKLKTFRSVLSFSQISANLLRDYENYCYEQGNSGNGVWGSLKFLKVCINQAIDEGFIKSEQLRGYKPIKYVNPVRSFLTTAELAKLEKFIKKTNDSSLKNIATWFVFCCYSGLRYGDAAKFNPEDIKDGKIILRTEKTGTDISIKVHPKLKEFMPSGRLPSNVDYNRNLKALGAGLGINKQLSSHLARHTHAVMFLERGGSMEVLSKLLGHSSMKVTALYGKITNKRIDNEISQVFG